jgi:hypothetical protein
MSTQSAQSALPSIMVVREMLLDLLGRDVKVAPSGPWAPTLRDPGAVAVYVDDTIRVRALISCNLELAVALGASIALIPANTASSCMEEGRLTEDLAENLNEVLNILSTLFNPPDRPHVKLHALHVPGKPPPPDLAAQLRAFGKREDLTIEVAGYGGGRLSLVLV